jgi:hypothetical protein
MFSYIWELCGTVWDFVEKITCGGILVYNEDDAECVSEATNPALAYTTPNYKVDNGTTLLELQKEICLSVFYTIWII